MKYIIVKDRDDKEFGIIFPDAIRHKDVARIHRATDVRVMSAGECRIGETTAAWSFSESLGGMASRPEDGAILERDFSNHVR